MSGRFSLLAVMICWAWLVANGDRSAPAQQIGQQTAEQIGQQTAERLFAIKIAPLLKEKCLGCHGGDPTDIKGDFSVLSREHLLKGGESEEPAVVSGQPDQGTLMAAIQWFGLEMPPKENDRLTAEQIELVEQWIAHGAPWPDEEAQRRYRDQEAAREVTDAGRLVRTSGGTSNEWTQRRYSDEDLWAFRPVKQLDARKEELDQQSGDSDPIDTFIDRRLDAVGLLATGMATPRALIRRATYDLTGLPPTPLEVTDFEAAFKQDSDGAWRAIVDRLLESPRYGEHWGRHWLDVTRYADTGGMSNDYERSNMWRYRDYVIRAFNQDKPYDQFIIEQLAGDELADQSVAARTAGSLAEVHQTQLDGNYNEQEAEWLVATGLLRLGPWDNAMIEADEARQIYLDDLVNITGQTFLSQTLRCCKCHDHKFDPIPTRDYYRIYAAFAATHMAERPVPHLPVERLEGFEAGRAHVRRMLQFAVDEKNKILDKQEAAARQWYQEHDFPYQTEDQRKSLPDEEKPPRFVGLDHVEQGQRKVREQDEWVWNRRLERFQPMAQSVYNSDSFQLAWNGARKLRIDRTPPKGIASKGKQPSGQTLQSHILLGGALTALGDRVFPGVLSAPTLPVYDRSVNENALNDHSEDPYLLPQSIDGRRLALARWIARADNPLTTRSIVNRIWQYHVGQAIAANPNNFGAKGAKPSHPQLLDYLAADFVRGGWSIKRLHRQIMLSDVYRRAAIPIDADQLAAKDPNNTLLSHFPRRRLTAEEIRDSTLAISGELVHCAGGLPVMPEINMEVALQPRMIQFSLAPAYQPSPTPELRNRRTVYAYQVRGQADPFTEVFNQPNPNESCERREAAAVTPQVFTLLNSDMMTDRCIALAARLEADVDAEKNAEKDKWNGPIQRAFELVLLRAPTAQELASLSTYATDMELYHAGVKPTPTVYPSKITRSLVEEFSGQTFEYQEMLPVFEHYTPDTKPGDVTARTRALADLCLLLLNTNEFMYVE